MSGTKSENRIYEFRVEGRLDPCWSEWFEGLVMRYAVDEETGIAITSLIGPVVDQPRLHGILEKISSLNIKLLSVNEVRTKADSRK